MRYWVYIVCCSDGSFYTGSHRGTSIHDRIDQHNNGTYKGYTFFRRPVELVWHQEFQSVKEAIRLERQIKGWSRKKKKALIENKFELLVELSKRSSNPSSS